MRRWRLTAIVVGLCCVAVLTVYRIRHPLGTTNPEERRSSMASEFSVVERRGGAPRLSWRHSAGLVEALGERDGTVYVVDEDGVAALQSDDGRELWRSDNEDALEASGGVRVGVRPGQILVWAPSEYALTLDRATGHVIARGNADADVPDDGVTRWLVPSEPTRYAVEVSLNEITGRWADGAVAWRVLVDSSMSDPFAVQVGDAVVVATGAGELLAIK